MRVQKERKDTRKKGRDVKIRATLIMKAANYTECAVMKDRETQVRARTQGDAQKEENESERERERDRET